MTVAPVKTATCADCRRMYPDAAPWSCPDCGSHDAFVVISQEEWEANHPGVTLNREPTPGPFKFMLRESA